MNSTTAEGLERRRGENKHVTSSSSSTVLRIALWVAQVGLMLMFLGAGFMKATTPIPILAQKLPWASTMPEAIVRFIGISELAGALGLVLPSLTRIRPKLTIYAALGLVTIMVLASVFHLSRGEAAVLPVNIVIGAVAAFIAWGRAKKAPIEPR
jgi:putative oxidoreductase